LSIKIALTDGQDRPKVNHEVYVKWKNGGISSGKTNKNGVYDTGMNGTQTIEQVTCYGRVLHNYDLRVNGNDTLALEYR